MPHRTTGGAENGQEAEDRAEGASRPEPLALKEVSVEKAGGREGAA